MSEAQKRGRRTLLAIAFLFAAPIGLATYMYYSGSSWNPAQSSARGELITPPRPLPELVLADDQLVFRETWSLVVLDNQECASACQNALTAIRQIRLSLGPKMTRMTTVFMPADSKAISDNLYTEHPVLIIAEPDQTIAARELIGTYQSGQIFLVDPLGNLMMSYAPGTDMGDIRKDLAHLLKLSGIG